MSNADENAKPSDYTTIPINEEFQDFEARDFPSIDDFLKKSQTQKRIRRKQQHIRSRTCQSEPANTAAISETTTPCKSPSDSGDELPIKKKRANSHIKFLQDNFKAGHLKGFTKDMPRKVMKNLAPTRIPVVQRFVTWGKKTWFVLSIIKFMICLYVSNIIRPGYPKYKFILQSPYFFLYIISMALIQAAVAAFSVANVEVVSGFHVGALVSTTFFGLYILEVILRVSSSKKYRKI